MSFQPLKIKENVAVAGLSAPLVVWKPIGPLLLQQLPNCYLNSNLLIVLKTSIISDATEVYLVKLLNTSNKLEV